MDISTYKKSILDVIDNNLKWRSNWEEFQTDNSLLLDSAKTENILEQLQTRLNKSYPFFHPNYIGQMISPPHQIAMIAYFMAMQINPNNHALDGGPATTELENEVIEELAKMFGYKIWLGHLTASGTIANLEALWVAREINPNKKIAFSSDSHYTHKRICELLRTPFVEIPTHPNGKIDLTELSTELSKNEIGTLVVNIGTTGLGAIDDLQQIILLTKKFGVRLHADAAYGGFFTLLLKKNSPLINPESFLLLNQCDSIVVDPHKKGLQPYGCGCVIFKDPSVGKFYKHDSPYTYFTSKELHLGEVTLECSRAGASAAAFWATLKAFPLLPDSGLGLILSKTIECTLQWNKLINNSDILRPFITPELDIVTYFPVTNELITSTISERSEEIFNLLMNRKVNPVYLAKYKASSQKIKLLHPEIIIDSNEVTILRSVFMKPEHNNYIQQLFNEISKVAKTLS